MEVAPARFSIRWIALSEKGIGLFSFSGLQSGKEVSMEDSKVRSLIDHRLKVVSRSGQPAVDVSSPPVPPKPKLLDQVRQAIRTRHYSPRTEEAYVHWIKRFIFFHNKRHPAEISLFVRESCITGSSRSSRLSRSSGFKDP